MSELNNHSQRFDDLIAKCPNCARPLTLDEMGTPTCNDCEHVLGVDLDAIIALKNKIIAQDNEILILVPGAEKILRRCFPNAEVS